MTQSDLTLANTLFGISRGLEPTERSVIRDYLRAAWRAQYGRGPSSLHFDLETLSDLFRPHVQAKRLRDAAEELDIIAGRRPPLPETVFVPVDEHRGFVTPEGRVLLDQLERIEHSNEQIIGRDAILSAYALIANFYGDHQRRWMRKELAGGSVRPATLGYAIFLLINNSIGAERALLLPDSPTDEAALAGKILPVINAFSISVGGSPVTPRERERLRSNWIITETKRQMGRYISRSTADHGVRFWIESDREAGLLAEIGRQLTRRKNLTAHTVNDALQRTLVEYSRARPLLASWGLAYERPGHTERVFGAIADAFNLDKGADYG